MMSEKHSNGLVARQHGLELARWQGVEGLVRGSKEGQVAVRSHEVVEAGRGVFPHDPQQGGESAISLQHLDEVGPGRFLAARRQGG